MPPSPPLPADYDPYQTERVKVVSRSGATVQVTPALRFMHYGQVTQGVDERAEVGWDGWLLHERQRRSGRWVARGQMAAASAPGRLIRSVLPSRLPDRSNRWAC